MGVMIQFYFEHINQNVYPISNTESGLIIAAFFAAELLGAPAFGAWSDRYGRKLFIVLGPLFGVLAVQITALTTVIWILIFTRLLEGLSTASNAPATLGFISAATSRSPSLRGRVVGFFELATVGGLAAGLWLGGLLWQTWGQPLVAGFLHLTAPAFAIDGLVYLLSLVILAWGLRETEMDVAVRRVAISGSQAVQQTWKRYWQLATSGRVWQFVPAWLAVNAVLGVWLNHVARQLTRSRDFADQLLTGGFAAGAVGSLFAVLAIVFALGILAWGMVLGRLRKTSVMLIGAAGLLAATGSLFLLNHLPSLSSSLVLPLAGLFALGLLVMSGFTPAALAYLADITEDYAGDRGAIMGLYSVFLSIGQFVGSALGGPFADWRGIDGIVGVTCLLALFAGATVIALRRTEDRSARPADKAANLL
jgi:MFS family permease